MVSESPGAPPYLGSPEPDRRKPCDLCPERSLVCLPGPTYLCRVHAEMFRAELTKVLEGPRGG